MSDGNLDSVYRSAASVNFLAGASVGIAPWAREAEKSPRTCPRLVLDVRGFERKTKEAPYPIGDGQSIIAPVVTVVTMMTMMMTISLCKEEPSKQDSKLGELECIRR